MTAHLPKLFCISALPFSLLFASCSDVRLWRPGELERISVEFERPNTEEPTQKWTWTPNPGPEIRYRVGDIFCTKESLDITIPFKLLIIMDYSGSMDTSDPQGLRIDAVENLVNEYSNDPYVYFGFLRFGSQPVPLPELGKDFTNEQARIRAAITELRRTNTVPDGATNYQDSLAWAWDAIDQDMRHESHIPGTRYGILFVTDGRPNLPETGDPDAALAANRPKVRDKITGCDGWKAHQPLNKMIEFLNTYFINVSNPDPPAAQLLRDMAEGTSIDPCGPDNWGHGTFTEVNDPGALTFDVELPTLRKVFVNRGGMVFLNYGVRAAFKDGEMVMARDSDGDGLPDFLESADPDPNDEWDTSRYHWDTDGDGISDLVAWSLGLKSNQQSVSRTYPRPAVSNRLAQHGILLPEGKISPSEHDLDADGLTNEEEDFLGTEPSRADTDKDGISDYLEVRFGLNPNEPGDAALDADGDGFDNKTEVETGMDPHHVESPAFREKNAFRLQLGNEFQDEYTDSSGNTKIRMCYEFSIENILYMSSLFPDGPSDFNVFEMMFIDQTRLPLDDLEIAPRREIFLAEPLIQVPNYNFERTFPNHW